jgi:hypothetical protein
MIHQIKFIRVLFLLMPLAIAPMAHATLTFGTTPSGPLAYTSGSTYAEAVDTFNSGLPAWIWSTGGFEFSLPSGEYTFESLTVPLSLIGTVPVTFTLYSGGGQPQTELDSSTMNLSADTLQTFDFTGNVQLQGGQNYFLIATVPQSTTSGSQLDWYGNTAGANVPFVYGQTWLTGLFQPNGFLGWNSTTFGGGPAWQIQVSGSSAPEPAAMALAGLGLLAIGCIRKKRAH